jgi:beta-xylosidase
LVCSRRPNDTIAPGSSGRLDRVTRKPLVLLVALALLLVAGCGGGGKDDEKAAPRPPRSTTTSPAVRIPTTTSPPVAAAGADPGPPPTLPPPADPQRPAIITTPGENVPNPVVLVEDRYYLYATQTDVNGKRWNIPVRTSDNPRSWKLTADALPSLPPWVDPVATWAPDVRRVENRYVMFFTARVRQPGPPMQCIGLAVADNPLGPFTPNADPFICQRDHRGSIDPRTFVDADGSLWLLWKADDNGGGGKGQTSIWSARLRPDGLALAEPGRPIFGPDQVWEGQIVEAPQMVLDHGIYWVFYSANWYNQPAYSLGVAACQGPAGPCIKALPKPWLASNAQGKGPGEASLFKDRDGSWWMVYAPNAVNFRQPTPRPAALAKVMFTPQLPYLAAP